jgi:Fe-Mn family superoxide dismutase
MAVYSLTPLGYTYDALEPFFDRQTMEIHHQKHWASYVKNLNSLIAEYDLRNLPPSSLEMVTRIRFLSVQEKDRERLIFNGGGVANHEFFFSLLKKNGEMAVPFDLEHSINVNFGTMGNFKKMFQESALSHRGSGWIWLCVNPAGKKQVSVQATVPELFICNTHDHDNPSMMDITKNFGIPVLCLDLWEHAYYLKFQNRKEEYIEAFWNVVNWQRVDELRRMAMVQRF